MTWDEMKNKMADFPADGEFAMGFYDERGEHRWFKIDEIAPNKYISLRDAVNCIKTWCMYMNMTFGCTDRCPFFASGKCTVNDILMIPSEDIPDMDVYATGGDERTC